jgi:hypothetical protein
MDNRIKKDKSLHANLPTLHPLRAVRRTDIRATTHLAESELATSTPRPPPLVPAPAATSSRPTTTQNCMPVLFKKPNHPSKGLVRAKQKLPLQRPINEIMISKINLEGRKTVNLNAESNKDFNIKSARLN